MYCIKCGVELADTEKSCPLCATRVFHPDIARPEVSPLYPPDRELQPSNHPRAELAIVTALFLLPMIITLLCNLHLSDEITWSGYVIGALQLCYACFVLPFWFRKPNAVIFVPCGFAVATAYLFYIDLQTGGETWFLTFALPLMGFLCLVVTTVTALYKYVRKGQLYYLAGGAMALGAFFPVMGWLLNLTFQRVPGFAFWTLYPATALLLLGGTLLYFAICRSARESLKRKLFF